MASGKLRIIVMGYIVRGPLGGMTWHHLQYVLGLHRLGHDVYFFEDSDDYESCYDPRTHNVGADCSYGLDYARTCFDRVGLTGRWTYYDAHKGEWHGSLCGKALDLVRDADLIINVSGVNPLRPWFEKVPVRAFIDTDPAFTQIKHLTRPEARELASRHNVFLTFGENIAEKQSAVPDDGFPWQATRQPIALDQWPVLPVQPDAHFSTVMQWDSYPALEYDGRSFGMKSASFAPFIDFPKRTASKLELALGSGPDDTLRDSGWHIVSSLGVSSDPWTYQNYIQSSKGEFAVAKQGYVEARSGWFSERSACYMASGRPVVVQDTGFKTWLKADGGVLAFTGPDEAAAALEAVESDYPRHCRRARAAAEQYFEAARVMTDVIEKCSA